MKLYRYSIAAITACSLLQACDNSDNIGTSIIQDEVSIIVDSSFTITGKSINNERVQSRTITQLLGSIDAGEYGKLSSDFVTQFMPASRIDTTDVTVNNIDSLKLIFSMTRNGFVGDSLVPMGLEVYRLNRQLPSPIYSDFDPTDYYSESDRLSSEIYNCNYLGQSDSVQALTYRDIEVKLPLSLAKELFTLYKENPDNYVIPTEFAKSFPGIYVKNTFGSGRVIRISATLMSMFYHIDTQNDEGRDTTYNYIGNYYAVSPEIITNNNISYQLSNSLSQRTAAGENIIVAPAGLDVELTFPAIDIIDRYKDSSGALSLINTLSFTLPAEEIENKYGITPPQNLLMVLSNKKDEFFAKNEITDNKYSFYATYNSATKSYAFSDMRNYLIDLLKKEDLKPEDYTFTITPVNVITESSGSSYYYQGTTYISSIVPYVETPVMIKLNLDKAKIILTYSKQTVNF